MTYTTVEVAIEHGKVTVIGPERLPKRGRGLLVVLSSQQGSPQSERKRVRLPLIEGDGIHVINPTPEQLD